MKIGELASAARTAVETIRFYERVGLLPPPDRSAGNYRVYGNQHVERLQFIRNCRSLDMTLDEVRTLLSTKDDPSRSCTDVNDVLDEHIQHVTSRIADLKGLERTLLELRRQCAAPTPGGECGILTGLSGPAAHARSPKSHIAMTRKRTGSRD